MTWNAIQCKYCNKVLESVHTHDYRTHSCQAAPPEAWNHQRRWVNDESAPGGQRLETLMSKEPPMIMVDGGLDYARRGGVGHYIELSEYADG